MNKPARVATFSGSIGPLSAALFGGYATGTAIMLLIWHLI